jgi:hypothetical protein
MLFRSHGMCLVGFMSGAMALLMVRACRDEANLRHGASALAGDIGCRWPSVGCLQ